MLAKVFTPDATCSTAWLRGTTLKMSDVGFVAAGFPDGSVAVIDLRGPALIYDASIYDFGKACETEQHPED